MDLKDFETPVGEVTVPWMKPDRRPILAGTSTGVSSLLELLCRVSSRRTGAPNGTSSSVGVTRKLMFASSIVSFRDDTGDGE